MISYAAYKVLHYLGLFGLFVTLGAALGRSGMVAEGATDPWKKRLAILHGVSLLVVLTAGFGLMARIGVMHGVVFPGWVWIKLAIWLVVGGLVALAFRRSPWVGATLVLLPVLAAVAGWVALTKPF